LVHGSPWPGSARFVSAESAPLQWFFLLDRNGPDLTPVSTVSEFLDRVLPLTYHRPWDERFSASTLEILGDVMTKTRVFRVNRTAIGSPNTFFKKMP